MPHALDPIIAEKLAAFARRWRRLLAWRGVCGGVITLLGAMTLIAVADWLFLMGDGVRLALSVVGYLGTAAVVWFTALRWLVRTPGPRELARLIEKARPDLREDLLSAIELSEPGSSAKWDSETFRALLQESVVARLRDVEMAGLLPPSLIAFWLRTAAVALVVCAALWFVPGLGYDRLLVRALAPMANVERVSRNQIRLVEPAAFDAPQPQGDNLAIVVEVTGPDPDKVLLETFPRGRGTERSTMPPQGRGRFATTVIVGAEPLEFRVRAGDGMTKRFLLQSRPRPHVAKFDKTFHAPAYTRRAPRRVVEENGDLTGLEGTEVELRLRVNQPVKAAELQVEAKGKTNLFTLARAGTNATELVTRLPLREAGTYRVRLVAAETGFENKFSPQYEIRTLADLLPRVAIESPKQDFIAPPEEVVLLQGSASDDIGLAKVAQLVQVNDGPWSELLLAEDCGTNVTVSPRWDLLKLAVTPGDRVSTKLVAIDLKGGRGESGTLRVVISSAGVDTQRLRALDGKQRLQDALTATRKAADDLRKSLTYENAVKLRAADEVTRKQMLAGATTALEDIGRHVEQGFAQAQETLKTARPGRDSADLAAVGRALSEVKHSLLTATRADLDQLMQGTASAADRNDVTTAVQDMQRLADASAAIEQAGNDLLASDRADVIAENLAYLAREQHKMNVRAAAEGATDADAWDRLARREGGATKETQAVEAVMRELQQQLPKNLAERAGRVTENLKSSRANLERSLTAAKPGPDLLPATQAMQRGVESAGADLRAMERELAVRADKGREDLNKLAGTHAAKVDKVRAGLLQLAAVERVTGELAKRELDVASLKARAKRERDKTAADWKAAVEQLKDRAALEERRRDSDPQFVADMTQAAQALAELRTVAGPEGEAQKGIEPTKQLEKALRALEAGHALEETRRALDHLAQQERWEKATGDATTSRPKDWDWLERRLNAAPGELKRACLPDKATQAMLDASRSPSAAAVNKEMAERQSAQKPAASVSEPADKLQAAVEGARREAAPALADARAAVAKAAPRLHEMMAGLARASEEMEVVARASAQSAGAKEEARQQLGRQQELEKQVEDLKAAVRRDANVQDMTKPEGRARSRDADDAVAMLREPPPRATQALRDAAAAKESAPQRAALNEAAAQEKKLAESLNHLAKHYENLANGRGEETRSGLRKAEEELGIKSGLDEQYERVEKLAGLVGDTPEATMKNLERELAQNAAMRQELTRISQQAASGAKETLAEAVASEQKLARDIGEAKKGADAAPAHEQTRALAAQARRLATNDIPQAARELFLAKVNGAAEAERARQAMTAGADRIPTEANRAPQTLARPLQEAAMAMQKTAEELRTTADRAAFAARMAKQPDDQKAAQSAHAKATQAADAATQLAQQARSLAAEMAAGNQSPSARTLAQAGREQERVTDAVAEAGADLQRAGRHESRLGTPRGEALQQMGKQTEALAERTLAAAEKSMTAAAKNPAGAEAAAESARAELERQRSALDAAMRPPSATTPSAQAGPPAQSGQPSPAGQSPSQPAGQSGKQAGSPSASPAPSAMPAPQPGAGQPAAAQPPSAGNEPLSPHAAEGQMPADQGRWLARMLDRMDAAMNPSRSRGGQPQPGDSPGGQPGQQGKSAQPGAKGQGSDSASGKAQPGRGPSQAGKAAAKAGEAAMQSQLSSMMASRSEGKVPGEASGSEASGESNLTGGGGKGTPGKPGSGLLPMLGAFKDGDWGRLPPKVAQGLAEGQREGTAGEFRQQVETYFRVVAERAKERK